MAHDDLSGELAVAERLARAAGQVILRHYSQPPAVEYKGKGHSDPVTAADREANALIVAGLAAAFPSDAILAEESEADPRRHDHARLWCVDPLDGTQEFIAHNGQFVVMIGLAIDGRARLGVVYQPTEDRLVRGWGVGASVEQGGVTRELRPSRVSDPRDARLMISRSHPSKTVARVAEILGITRVQPLGSVGLKALQVALGEAEAYLSVSDRTQEWDACAPEAILRAAGGLMTDCVGAPLGYNKPATNTPRGLLATNGLMHRICLTALAPVAAERGWR